MEENDKKKDSGFNNLLLNIIIPAIILMKGAKWLPLDSVQILILALAFPFFYGLYDLFVKKEKNFISILGFVSILLSGIVGILELPTELIAIKEAAIPFIIGCVIIISNYTSYPIAPKLLYHDDFFDKPLINEHLTNEQELDLEQKIKKASFFLFLSFMLSAVLNYVLAKYFLKSPTGTDAFNDELGQMTLYSFPVIALPSTLILLLIMRYVYINIKKYTGLTGDDILLFKK